MARVHWRLMPCASRTRPARPADGARTVTWPPTHRSVDSVVARDGREPRPERATLAERRWLKPQRVLGDLSKATPTCNAKRPFRQRFPVATLTHLAPS